MNVLASCNSNYLMPLTVMLTSLFENNKYPIEVFLLQSELSECEIEPLINMVESYQNKLNIIKIDKNIFADAPMPILTQEAYYRLLVQDMMPDNIDRVLYLDCDIIVTEDISQFYSMDLGMYCFAICKDSVIETCNWYKEHKRNLGIPDYELYFNSGVVLYNLDEVRRQIKSEQIFEFLEQKREYIRFVDQDVLNGLFWGKVKFIYDHYNKFAIGKKVGAIMHYAGLKPWNPSYYWENEELWVKYYKLTDFYLERRIPLKIFLKKKFLKLNRRYIMPIITACFPWAINTVRKIAANMSLK